MDTFSTLLWMWTEVAVKGEDEYGGIRECSSVLRARMREFQLLHHPRTKEDAFKFWAELTPIYAAFEKTAKALWSVPATSASSESAFSKAGIHDSKYRGQLDRTMLNYLSVIMANAPREEKEANEFLDRIMEATKQAEFNDFVTTMTDPDFASDVILDAAAPPEHDVGFSSSDDD